MGATSTYVDANPQHLRALVRRAAPLPKGADQAELGKCQKALKVWDWITAEDAGLVRKASWLIDAADLGTKQQHAMFNAMRRPPYL